MSGQHARKKGQVLKEVKQQNDVEAVKKVQPGLRRLVAPVLLVVETSYGLCRGDCLLTTEKSCT